ncbi:MAG: hypothetical protein QNK04_06805 [Myxococcota bacterium]|nr:hypothetical protein [Myxococcota bacterium]
MRRIAWVVAGLLAATGCATPPPVLRPLPPGDPRPAALLSAWTEAAETRRALRGRARLSVDGGDGAVRLRSNQIVVLERPDQLRVEIQGFLNQTVAVLVTDGDRFEVFRVTDRSYESGPVHEGLLWEQAYLALTPAEAIDLLLGVPTPDPALRPGAALDDGDGGVRLDLVDGAGATVRRAGFDREARLRWLEALGPEEALIWRAELGDYAPVDGTPFAHALALEVAAGGTRAEISLRDVELNPELPPDIFRLRAPSARDRGSRAGG